MKRLSVVFLAFLLLLLAVGCGQQPQEGGEALLAGGELRLEDLQDEDGAFQLESLPVGTSKADVQQRFGDSLNFGGGVDTSEIWGLLEKASYKGYDVQVTFELNNEALELVHLYFRIPEDADPEAGAELYDALSQEMEELYGAPDDVLGNENQQITSTVSRWYSTEGERPTLANLGHAQMNGKTSSLYLMFGLNQLITDSSATE